MNEPITLGRDCEAVQIPNGDQVTIPAGTPVRIAQSLGGAYMGEVLRADVERKVFGVPGVGKAFVEVVFDPAWDPSRMSEAAKLELNML